MLPALIAMAAQLLSEKQKKKRAAEDMYQQQVASSASRLGGGEYLMNDAYNNSRAIDEMSADYGPLLKLLGSSKDEDLTEDEEDMRGYKVKPSSNVYLKRSEF